MERRFRMIHLNFLKRIPGTLDYYANEEGGIFSQKKDRIIQMKVNENVSGYFTVTLCIKNASDGSKNNRGSKMCQAHRLTASAWILNPKNLPIVNHKDGNKQNNHISNLEWVSSSQNAMHSRDILGNAGHVKSVIQVTLKGDFLARYKSLKEAEKSTGVDSRAICQVCKGKRRKAGEYVWFYETEYEKGKGMRKLAQCKRIAQYTRTGVFIREFESAKDAASEVGALASNISNACAGRLQSSKGYVWKYLENEKVKDETEGWIILDNYPYDKISPDGRVFSTWGKRIKKQQDRSGYKFVSVTSEGRETKMAVHRLVATAYIPNPENHPMVNHKDGNPSNNNVSNLEWCTASQNAQHAHDTGLCSSKKKVLQIKNGEIVGEYDSMKKAAEAVGVSPSAIGHVCLGDTRLKTAGGYGWKYK